MAQFYGDLQGNRGQATRMGTKSSGISGHLRGWNIGARVFVGYNEDKDRDEVTISITHGSNGAGYSKGLGTFRLGKKNKIIKVR